MVVTDGVRDPLEGVIKTFTGLSVDLLNSLQKISSFSSGKLGGASRSACNSQMPFERRQALAETLLRRADIVLNLGRAHGSLHHFSL